MALRVKKGFKIVSSISLFTLIGITLKYDRHLTKRGPDYADVFAMGDQSFRGITQNVSNLKHIQQFHRKDAKTLYQEAIKVHKSYRKFQENLRMNNLDKNDAAMETYISDSLPLQDTLLFDLKALVKQEKDCDKELNHLQQIVVKRIHELQNPINCKTARKLFCVMQTPCGLGCLVHHYTSCLLAALGTNRTLILDLSSSKYLDMESVIQPLSKTCDEKEIPTNLIEWQGEESKHSTPNDISEVKMTIAGLYDRHTRFTGHTVPQGILEKLRLCHADPEAWWIGQIVKYITRLKPFAEDVCGKIKEIIGFIHPIVGIHVRRTDKKAEADYHELEEYMRHVTSWYNSTTTNAIVKRVYVATDEPSLLNDLEKNYPSYVFLHDPLLNKQPSLSYRFLEGGLMGTMIDTLLLAQSDYFVGTFSSNIGRLVYELMQADGERTFDSKSVDSPYEFLGGYTRYLAAVEDFQPQGGENELKAGDLIELESGPYNRFTSYGFNDRTQQSGNYSKYNLRKVFLSASYPGIS